MKTCRIDLKTTIDNIETVFVDADETINEIFADGNMNIKYVPPNIYRTYPNLISLSFYFCSLGSISKVNFEQLYNLRILALHQNKISVIDNDTFNDLESLEVLYLDSNRIIKVDGQGL